jgi:hypothetical protein
MTIFNEGLKFEVVFRIRFLANFHNILGLNIKMQQELFHWLRNAKQLNIWNLTNENDIREPKPDTNYEKKFYFWRNKPKRNFAVYFVSRYKRNFQKQCFCFALFRVLRNKKRMRNGNRNPDGRHFLKFYMKTLKLKIPVYLIRNTSNFVSIQWNSL